MCGLYGAAKALVFDLGKAAKSLRINYYEYQIS